ncbi:MAG: poly-gamma-glutamate biosynthesis protein PgsC/CapC [Planctomycetota bacterium]
MLVDVGMVPLPPDVARLAFILGIGLSVWLYDRWHLSCGSIITPAYLALHFDSPQALGVTLLTAALTYGVVYIAMPRFVVMTGKTRFLALMPVAILVSMALHTGPGGQGTAGTSVASDVLVGIGFIVPGLLAHDVATQGARNTAFSVSSLTVGLAIVTYALAGVALTPAHRETAELFAFEASWLPLAVLLSVLASVALSDRYGVRAGGFVGAAYIAMLSTSPFELITLAVIAWLTHAIVVRGLMPRAIVFGRRKFAAMLLVAATLSWIWTLVRGSIVGLPPDPLGYGAFALVSMTLPGLLANDAERVGGRRMALGLVLATTFTLSGVLFARSLRSGDDAFFVALCGSVLVAASLSLLTSARWMRESPLIDQTTPPSQNPSVRTS